MTVGPSQLELLAKLKALHEQLEAPDIGLLREGVLDVYNGSTRHTAIAFGVFFLPDLLVSFAPLVNLLLGLAILTAAPEPEKARKPIDDAMEGRVGNGV
ncbi:hypothetical protein RQP46_009765 [Phenoliferia psychrophenolica]